MNQQSIPIHVLVIDDDSMSRELLCVLLEGEGYAVESADSGEAALTLLTRGRPAPDVVLADMQMPGTTGGSLAGKLRRACGRTTILLAMSGSQPAANAISHFDGFLLKPFKMQEVADALAARSQPAVSVKKKTRAAASARSSSSSSSPATIYTSAPETASNTSMQSDVQEAKSSHGIGNGGSSASPVLNEKIYQQLASSMPAPQLLEMYTMCVNDARERIAVMRRLLATHDAARFVREAHAIKGSCGMLGATQLHGMAAELERGGIETAETQGTQEVNSLDELSAACDRLERMLGSRV